MRLIAGIPCSEMRNKILEKVLVAAQTTDQIVEFISQLLMVKSFNKQAVDNSRSKTVVGIASEATIHQQGEEKMEQIHWIGPIHAPIEATKGILTAICEEWSSPLCLVCAARKQWLGSNNDYIACLTIASLIVCLFWLSSIPLQWQNLPMAIGRYR